MQPNEVAKRNAEVFLRSLSQTDLDPRVVCGPHGEIHVRLFCTRDLRNEHHVKYVHVVVTEDDEIVATYDDEDAGFIITLTEIANVQTLVSSIVSFLEHT